MPDDGLGPPPFVADLFKIADLSIAAFYVIVGPDFGTQQIRF